MADAHEAARDGVQQETAQELMPIERHGARTVVVSVILEAEGHALLIHRQQPSVRDGDAVGVTRQVLEHLRRSAKGRLSVDDPVMLHRRVQQPLEGAIVFDADQLAGGLCALEQVDELAAQDAREDAHRQEEPGAAGNPLSIGRQSTAGDDAVNVRV